MREEHTGVRGIDFIVSKTSLDNLNRAEFDLLKQKADDITRNLFPAVHILFRRQSNCICLEN